MKIAGERACPPEDCGGVGGYMDIINVLEKGAKNEDERELLGWLGDYDPEDFAPERVKFEDPKKRYKMAFS
jgi:pRiA4b ORF-3-like protein